jgi:hypothetical protein
MIVFHDYQCQQCGHVQEDVMHDTQAEVVRQAPCTQAPCEGTALMLFRTFNRFRHDHPKLYGRADPQIGREVIRDHAHKRKLLRAKGMIESDDAVKGDRERWDEIETQPRANTGLPVIQADSLEEIDRQLGSSTEMLSE